MIIVELTVKASFDVQQHLFQFVNFYSQHFRNSNPYRNPIASIINDNVIISKNKIETCYFLLHDSIKKLFTQASKRTCDICEEIYEEIYFKIFSWSNVP